MDIRFGLENLSQVLSQLLKQDVVLSVIHRDNHTLDYDSCVGVPLFNKSHTHILTTQIHGELSGKFYFILQQKEFDLLSKMGMGDKIKMNQEKEEFALEITNILAWSIMSYLGNQGLKKVSLSRPETTFLQTFNLPDLIYDDFSEFTDHIHCKVVQVTCINEPDFNPLLAFILDNEVQTATTKELANLPAINQTS